MSVETLKTFVDQVSKDEALAVRLEAALDGRQGDGAAEALLSFAREAGFDIDAQDVALLRGAAEGELGDDQLDAVAGGWFGYRTNVARV